MTSLIAALSTGKGTWAQVSQLMNANDWDSIFLVTNDFGKEKFTHSKAFTTIVIQRDITSMIATIGAALKGKILDTEIAVNLTSGNGNEHMAILSAVLKSGLGLRLVVAEDEGFKVI